MSDFGVDIVDAAAAARAGGAFWLGTASWAVAKLPYVGFVILGFWLFVAIAAPWLTPFPPNQTIRPMAFPGAPGAQRGGVLVRH